MPRRAATLECLDDDHSAAATWTGIRGWLGFAVIRGGGVAGFLSHLRNTEQLTGSGDVLGPSAIGEQAIVADAVESAGQHVDEEAAYELVGGECHHLRALLLVGAVILPFESDRGIVERDETAVADGDTVGVARQVGQHRLRAAEWPLRVDHPFGFA